MATKYWVGGNGNWSSATNWRTTSGGATVTTAPGSADAAVLDANSGASVVTIDSNITIQTLTCTGFTGTLAFGTNTISLNSTGTIFTGATTMTVTGTPQIICTDSSATSRTISPLAVTEANSISFRITAGTGTLSLGTAGSYRNLDFTDGTNPTGYAGALGGGSITVYGNFKASTGMTQSPVANTITFAATSGTKTITTAAVVFDRPFTFSGVGGSWQLQDALTSGATRLCTVSNGTLDLNGYTLTTGTFSSASGTTRTLAFGSTGKIVITGNNATVFQTSTGTALTVTGSKRVELSYSGGTGTRTISGATNATVIEGTNLLNYFVTAGSDSVVFVSARNYETVDFSNGGTSTFTGTWTNATSTTNVYGNLILNSEMVVGSGAEIVSMKATSGTKTITSAGKTIDFPLTISGLGGTFACSDALTLGATQPLTMVNGTLQLKAGVTSTVGSFVTTGTTMKYLQSTTPGTQATISDASGTNDASYLTIQDIYATGGATWNAFASNQNIDNGNNLGWFFSDQSLTTVVFNRRKRKRLFL
jgi:fibronectin-binding autotransporter adhesin